MEEMILQLLQGQEDPLTEAVVDEAVEANVFLHYSVRFCAGL